MVKFFRKLFGLKYLVNISTYEIHKLSNVNKACGVHKMAKHNKWYINERKFKSIVNDIYNDYNGCIHCNRDFDTDKKYF